MKIVLKVILVIFILIIVVAVIGLLFLFFYPGVGKVPNKENQKYYAEINSNYYDNQFHNIEETTNNNVVPKTKIPVQKWGNYPEASEFTINWLGHSSLLIQMDGNNILIDPVLKTYASPVTFVGSKRFADIPILPKDVPEIDTLLISHDHYDHLDYQTIKAIDKKVKNYVVPLGVDSYLKSWGIDENKIHVLNWWDKVSINGIEYVSTPARHYSGRNPLKANSTLWSGYYFKDANNSVFYTGDSGYSEVFKEIVEKCGNVDILFADSGQYNKAWSQIHMNPLDSLQVAVDVQAKYFIPVHWGAFVLSDHDWNAPIKIAYQNKDKYGVNLITPQIGERVKYAEIENYKNVWWNLDEND